MNYLVFTNTYFYAMALAVFSKKSPTYTCYLVLKTLNIHHGINKMLIAGWLSKETKSQLYHHKLLYFISTLYSLSHMFPQNDAFFQGNQSISFPSFDNPINTVLKYKS